MASTSSLLASTTPTAIVPADVTIGHVYASFSPHFSLSTANPSSRQLRDLIICPREAGIVNYVQGHSIIEHDLHSPDVVRIITFMLAGRFSFM
jgi:hypothetical protein